MTESRSLAFTYQVVDLATLRPHEEVVESHVEEVLDYLARSGVLSVPVVADAETRVILDGHHRHEALRRLGCTRAPVAFVDYHDPRIVVETWRAGEAAPSKEEVLATARAGRRYPPKSTRHRVLNAVPAWPVKLADLR